MRSCPTLHDRSPADGRRRQLACCAAAACLAIPLALASSDANLPAPGSQLLVRMMQERFEIVADKPAGGGIMGARKWTVRFPDDGLELKLKWKRAPQGGEGWNNSPRRELAAYAIQQLFLDPPDYLVPPVTTACIPSATIDRMEQQVQPNLPGAACIYGVLSAWLQDVHPPEKDLSQVPFWRNPGFAHHLANMNLLCYLIDHRDGRMGNYLVSDDPQNPKVFSIDNGLSFGVRFRNIFIPHWNRIRVPALPRRSVEQLRLVRTADLQRLGVLAQMEADDQGILRHVPLGVNQDPSRGNRASDGAIQIGLTSREIEQLERRIEKLLADVDKGRVRLM